MQHSSIIVYVISFNIIKGWQEHEQDLYHYEMYVLCLTVQILDCLIDLLSDLNISHLKNIGVFIFGFSYLSSEIYSYSCNLWDILCLRVLF